MKKVSNLTNFGALPTVPEECLVPFERTYQVLDHGTRLGIEVEVENIRNLMPSPLWGTVWNVTEDNSLRNNGREFVSYPLKASQVEQSLRALFQVLPPDIDFSARTSIHVHMNVRTMTLEQLKWLTFIYVIFEKLLFNFVGEDRDKNIHCVPLAESTILPNLATTLARFEDTVDISWMKYCAYNLLPTIDRSRGTVEFRHMHGTSDINKLMKWINLILHLKMYVYHTPLDVIKQTILQLNSTSQYVEFTHQVFGDMLRVLVPNDEYKQCSESMAQSVSLIKGVIGAGVFITYLKRNVKSRFAIPDFDIPMPQGFTSFGADANEMQPIVQEQQTFQWVAA